MGDSIPGESAAASSVPAPRGIRPEEVTLLIDELRPLAVGTRVDKVLDSGPDAFLIRLNGPDGRLSLLLSTSPGFSRFHLLESPPPAAEKPTEAAMTLRGLLGGGVLKRVDQPGGDRLVRLSFEVPRDGKRRGVDAVLEIFGRQGRLVICEANQRTIRFVHGRGGHRVGEIYKFPEPRTHPDALTLPFDPMTLVPTEQRVGPSPFHRALAERMDQAERTARQDARRSELRRRLNKELRRRRKLLEKLTEDLAGAERWEQNQRHGELLKAALGQLRRGESTVTVVDYFDEAMPEIDIPLDPRRTPAENVERLFKRARKGKRAIQILIDRLGVCEGDIGLLESVTQDLTECSSEDHETGAACDRGEDRLRQLKIPARASRRKGTQKQSQGPTGPRRFRSREGLDILAGRTSRENDRLTLTIANGNDIFFHRASRPGPHVILRVPRGRVAAPESIEDAAFLAAYLAGWRGPGSERVHWTPVKYVRKPKGLPPGKVLISQEREFLVSYQPELLGKLAIQNSEDP